MAKRTLLTSHTDPEEITYRQQVLADCLEHTEVIVRLYELAIAALAGERQVLPIWFGAMPDLILRRSVQLLWLYVQILRRLRQVADEQAETFRSEGFRRFFALNHAETKAVGAVSGRRFCVVVGHCRRCGREWPTHVQMCRECAAVLGEEKVIRCARVVPPFASKLVAPALAVVLALELSCRRPLGDDAWAARIWAMVEPRLVDAVRVRPGCAGSILAAWPLAGAEFLEEVAALALELSGLISRARQERVDLRGGIAVGVIDRAARTDAVERYAERLALAAAPGQWLVSDEPARRLEDRFVLGPAAIVPRWPMPVPDVHRALVERLVPPVLPSAVRGEVPQLVLGRDTERHRLVAELAAASAGRRRVVLVTAPAGGGKSYLLRRVLADAKMTPAAGVAFPPLGSRPLDPLRHLLAELERERTDAPEGRLSDALARAASRRARSRATAIVIDDIHWASPPAVAALASAIAGTEIAIPLAWILSTRTAALSTVSPLVELADITVALPPLEPADRVTLLGERLGTVRRRCAGTSRPAPSGAIRCTSNISPRR